MSGIGGYGFLSLSGIVQGNLDKSQGRLQSDVSRLSSGLRINSAADDPSGLAIAEGLESKVHGYDQAASNVQDANNALTVADGALQTVTDILQRIRTLAVGAANDVASPADRTNLQTEISELLQEVNTISQNTNFNGASLLNGSLSGSTLQQPATATIVSNAALASGSVSLASASLASASPAPAAVNLVSNPNLSTAPYISVPSAGSWTDIFPAPGAPGITQAVGINGWNYNLGGMGSLGVYSGAANLPFAVAPASPDSQQATYLSPMAPLGSATVTTQVSLTAGDTYTVNIDAAAAMNSFWEVSATGLNGGATDLTNGPQAISGGFAVRSFQMTATSTGTWLLAIQATSSPIGLVFLGDVSVTDNASVTPVTNNASVATTGGGLLVSSAVAANTSFATTAGGIAGLGGTGTGDGSIELQVINTGASIAAQETFINSATGAISVSPTLLAPNSTSTIFDNVAISTGNFSSPDLGVASYVKVSQNVAEVSGNPALSVHSGADEGDVLNVGLLNMSTAALRVSNIGVISSYGGDPSLAAEDTIGQVDQALASVLTLRAQIGASMVRLNDEASNDNVAGMNLQAAESNIRDLNVAQATTAYAAEQILSSIGTSILGNIKPLAASVERLFQ